MEEDGIFSNLFYESNVNLISKPDKDITWKEIYSPNIPTDIDVKTLGKILAN